MNDKIKILTGLLLTAPDPDVRRRAAEDLAEFDNKNVLTVLSIALQDENKGVEDAVARSLLSIGGAAAARAIVHHIEDDNITSRNQAAKLLIRLGEASIHAIIPYLKDDNKDVRKIAVDILGEVKSEEPVYYLLPLLKDSDPNVIASTLEAFGNIGSDKVIESICRTIEQYPFARIMAIEALGKIGGDSVREFLETKLRDALNVGNAEGLYLFALLDALGAIGNKKTLDMLLTGYKDIPENLHDVLLHVAIQIIERSNLDYQFEESLRKDLLHALHNDNHDIQLSAAKGLAQFHDPIVTRELLLSLGLSEEMDCVVIAQMSSRHKIFQIAIKCLEEGVIRGKMQFVLAIGKLASEYVRSLKQIEEEEIDEKILDRAFSVTAECWQDAAQEDWEIIVNTLFRLDCDRAAIFLQSVMTELDPWSRITMINQLITMPTYQASECIARFANDESEIVREAAQSALQSSRSAGILTATIKEVTSQNRSNRDRV
jgi:HEAT repeat protein